MFLRCHCEEGVSLTRQSSGTIGQPWGPSPRHRLDPDWIATSVLFETFLAMTKARRPDCHALTGSQ
ncbi:hypothetical protein N9D63_02975 [Opitutales bacterium]|nr:hypothetical protein [Opitutales bacterium]